MSRKPVQSISNRHLVVGLCLVTAIAMAAYCLISARTANVGKEKNIGSENNSFVTVPTEKKLPFAQDKAIPQDGQKKRPFRLPAPKPLPTTNLKDSIDALEETAKNGDSAIAFSLADALFRCRTLEMEYSTLQKQLESQQVKDDNAEEALDKLDQEYKSCKGLSPEQIKSYRKWLTLAARGGNVNAQVAYPTLMSLEAKSEENALNPDWIGQYRENSMNFLETAARNGSVDALAALAHTYNQGYLTDKNKVLAYAYMYATVQTGLVPSAGGVLNLWAQSMTAEELSNAINIGSQIYAGCCS